VLLCCVLSLKAKGFASRWVLSKLHHCIAAADKGFVSHEYSNVASATYDFWLKELCDVYLV